MIKSKILLVICTLLIGISSIYAESRDAYEFTLIKVNKVVDGQDLVDRQETIKNTINKVGLNVAEFSDSLISISWILHPCCVAFILTNNSKNSLKIFWDEAAIIDSKANSHTVMHNGVKMIDRDKEQKPTTLFGNTKMSDMLILTDRLEYSSYFQRWMFQFIIGKDFVSGTEVRVILPLMIKGQMAEYMFTFEVKKLGRKQKTLFNGGNPMYLID